MKSPYLTEIIGPNGERWLLDEVPEYYLHVIIRSESPGTDRYRAAAHEQRERFYRRAARGKSGKSRFSEEQERLAKAATEAFWGGMWENFTHRDRGGSPPVGGGMPPPPYQGRQEQPVVREKPVVPIAIRLVEAGFRALVKELHPDVGGEHEEMLLLQQAKAFLLRNLR